LTRQNPHHEKRWTILAFLGIAQLMIVLDVTVVNVALPSAQQALHFSNDERQWIITAYALAFGSLLLLGGKISDAYGRKRTLVIGISGFVVASALGGLAQSFAMLAGARALQGAFAALLAPAVLSLLSTTFTVPSERNKAFGIYGAILGSGASIGLLLGGALTELLDWRAVMFVNVFIAAAALSGVLALLVNETPREKPPLDLAGTVTVSAGLPTATRGLLADHDRTGVPADDAGGDDHCYDGVDEAPAALRPGAGGGNGHGARGRSDALPEPARRQLDVCD
jgi:MFS family permease